MELAEDDDKRLAGGFVQRVRRDPFHGAMLLLQGDYNFL
jgi:hypothetical protein